MSRIYSSLSGGELFEKITEEGYTMSEAEVINYMRQVCEGVKHMHERNIIHLGESARFAPSPRWTLFKKYEKTGYLKEKVFITILMLTFINDNF